MTVLSGARLVTPMGILESGWIETRDGQIVDVGEGQPPGTATDLGGAWLVPGFIDTHVHGGGGHDFTSSPGELARGVAYHRSRGTTRTLISLMTASVDDLCEQLEWVATAADAGSGGVVGSHLEGPFLAHSRCGAQNPEHLIPPDPDVLAKLVDAGRGHLRAMTFAPELPGGLDLVPDLTAAGVIAAVGHTDADYATAARAFQAGATLVTHLFNAMRPADHREPGPVVAALEAGVMCELVNDGVHIHDAMTRLVATHSPATLILITDAISATGAGDGSYLLGDQPVTVTGGQARLDTNGRLAGSTLTMDVAFRRAILDIGMSVASAVAAASTNPARLLGLSNRCGAIAPGLDADLVLLDDTFTLQRVMVGGEWV